VALLDGEDCPYATSERAPTRAIDDSDNKR
jgi:hypothetical protein